MPETRAAIFPEQPQAPPQTQGIKYAGSKLKLLPHIIALVARLGVNTVFDGFSGTTRVSQAFARLGLQVTSNDVAEWSYTFGVCYLKNTQPAAYYRELLEHLNALPGYDGWFTQQYGGVATPSGDARQADGRKKPWQVHNTRKLDAIRDEIAHLKLPEVDNAVALTALILGLDAVESTLGHYSAYLKQWSARSYKTLQLNVPQVIENVRDNVVIKGDIFAALDQVQTDLAYFDPPYGSNNAKMPPSRLRYAAYYHVWTSVIKHDKPAVFGKARRRCDSSDGLAASVFEEFRKDADGRFIALNAIERLIQHTRARYIALSYSSGGRATAEELHQVLTQHGRLLNTLAIDYKRNVMASMKWTNQWLAESQQPNKEFIFLLEK